MKKIIFFFCLLIAVLADYDENYDPEATSQDRQSRSLGADLKKELTDLQKYLRSTAAEGLGSRSNVESIMTRIQNLVAQKQDTKPAQNSVKITPEEDNTAGKQTRPFKGGNKKRKRPQHGASKSQLNRQTYGPAPSYGQSYPPPPSYGPSYPPPPSYGPSYPTPYQPTYESGVHHHPTEYEQQPYQEERPHHYSKLSLYEFKQLWIDMLYDVYKIINDDSLIEENSEGIHTLETIFYLLHDIDLVDSRTKERPLKCPYGYNKAGSLCLAAEFLSEYLSWEDARLYCQVVKGGDLIVFRNLCDFHDACVFINKLKPHAPVEYSYWVGATDLEKEGSWTYVDGTKVSLQAGLWGTRKGQLEPTGGGEQNYGLLLFKDFYYMHDVDNALATGYLYPLPLCQYIPERDGHLEAQRKPSGWGPYSSYDPWNPYAGPRPDPPTPHHPSSGYPTTQAPYPNPHKN